MDYYKKIKNVIENKEVNEGIRRLQSNKDTLNAYYKIGKLLVEAQGGEIRAKYENELIKNWSKRLVEQYGKGYGISKFKENETILYSYSKKCPA